MADIRRGTRLGMNGASERSQRLPICGRRQAATWKALEDLTPCSLHVAPTEREAEEIRSHSPFTSLPRILHASRFVQRPWCSHVYPTEIGSADEVMFALFPNHCAAQKRGGSGTVSKA